ncbi:MAG: alginate export family protein, partial [Gemmatimonadota bacterium]|nr:alginate export family protein [Gemmatimonadota bacterium]
MLASPHLAAAQRAFQTVLPPKVAAPIDSALLRQSAKAVARPEYQNSRFAESWLRRPPRGGGWDDPLKHIDIARGDVVHLTLSGSYRWRSEFNTNYMMSNAPAAQDQFAASRLLLAGDFRVGRLTGPYARAFAEYRDAQAFNRTLPGRLTTKELDRADFQNAFLEAGSGAYGVRYGRQEMSVGKERFVGVSDWSNARRAFHGVRAFGRVGPAVLDVSDVRVMSVRSLAWNFPDSTSRFRTVALSSRADRPAALTFRPASWHAYYLDYRAEVGARHERRMVGLRSGWRTPLAIGGGQAAIDAEVGTQRGYVGAKPLEAWFHAVEATMTFKAVRYSPMLQLALDRGSGTKGGADPRAGTLSTMYGSAHSYDGIADVFGVANLRIARLVGGAELARWLQLRTAVRSYRRVELGDGVYSK